MPSKTPKYLNISHWVTELINSNVHGTMTAQMDFIVLYGIKRSSCANGMDHDLAGKTVSDSLAPFSLVYTMICSDGMLWLHIRNLETEPKFWHISSELERKTDTRNNKLKPAVAITEITVLMKRGMTQF